MDRAPDLSTSSWMRSWALWTAPPRAVAWVLATVTAAAVLTITAWPTQLPRPGQLLTALVLLGCAAVCVESVRQIGEAAGGSNDLLSAWTLPVAFLLPPVWSLLVPIPLTLLLQLRVGRGPVYRRVFSVAAIGLSNAAVSLVFHHTLGWAGPLRWHAIAVAGTGLPARTAVLVLALSCAALGCAVNVVLIGTAVRLTVPQTTWRELVLDAEQRGLDLAEICLGVTVAVAWVVTPLLPVAMLAPILLVQRNLTLHTQLRAAARTDAKTGLLTATAWQEETDRDLFRAHRDQQPLAVLIIDIDHFKQVNDRHGHLAGDRALHATVTALQTQLRPTDQLGRFGGEEFTLTLTGVGVTEAADVAERLRHAVTDVHLTIAGQPVVLSVSIGVAVTGVHGHDLTDLLTAADAALYRAKQSGRNQVALAP